MHPRHYPIPTSSVNVDQYPPPDDVGKMSPTLPYPDIVGKCGPISSSRWCRQDVPDITLSRHCR